MYRGALRIAMAVRPDLRLRIVSADEGIVRRLAPIAHQPNDLSLVTRQVLGPFGAATLAQRDEEMPVGRKREPRAEVRPASRLRELAEDDGDVAQTALAELRARDGGPIAPLARFAEGEPDRAVGREVGIEHHIEEPALSIGVDPWQARERSAQGSVRTHDAHSSIALGDEHALVWQERERPRMRQAVGNGDGTN